ncbi:MAG: NUDIX hydrolase [Jatrophihabitantaceae bacterium]
MPKLDYYHDPAAPSANSIVVAASAFIENATGQVLMIQRSDNGLWAIPGGAQDVGESIASAAVREVHEETGIHIEVVGLVGIYSDPAHVIAYDDGEVRQEFSVCFRGRPVDGMTATSPESTRVEWVALEQLEQLSIHPSVRLRIAHGFEQRAQPYLG